MFNIGKLARPLEQMSNALVTGAGIAHATQAGSVPVPGQIQMSSRESTAAILSPIHAMQLQAIEFPSALYRGPSGHWSAGLPRHGIAV